MKYPLKTSELFAELDEQALNELPGEYQLYHAGDFIFRQAQEAQFFCIILSGRVELFHWSKGEKVIINYLETGMTAGHLQLLTNTIHINDAVAVMEVEVYRISKQYFWQLIADYEVVREKVLAEMQFGLQQLLLQNHMPMPGKLPLPHVFANFPDIFDDSLFISSSPTSWWNKPKEYLSRLMKRKKSATDIDELSVNKPTLPPFKSVRSQDPLERINAEIQLTEWLEECRIANAFDMSAVFTDAGLSQQHLEEMLAGYEQNSLNQYLDLLCLELELKQLAEQLQENKDQVSHLIAAINAYTYWGPSRKKKEHQIHKGLQKALLLVDYKIKQKGIKVYERFAASLPAVDAFENELLLAWIGILDHIIHSSQANNSITIITYDDIAFNVVIVEVIDHGTGVSKEDQKIILGGGHFNRASSPGLEFAHRIIVNHHSGSFHIVSRPGFTKLKISIPIEFS